MARSGGDTVSGAIVRLKRENGFGFIKSDNGGEECFFHRSAIREFDTLEEGQRVEFRRVDGQKGPRAEDVRLA